MEHDNLALHAASDAKTRPSEENSPITGRKSRRASSTLVAICFL